MNEPELVKKKEKNNFFKKYVYVFVIGLVMLLGTSYGLTFFIQNKRITSGTITVGGLSIDAITNNSINLTNQTPKNDSDGIKLNPVSITVHNLTANNGKVSVVLERTSGLDLADLKYGLFINGVLKTIASVPSSGVLYESALLGSETINVEARLWVKSNYTGNVTTFIGSLNAELSLDSMLASSFISNYDNTKNYVSFNCNNGVCETWRIKGVESGRLVLTTTAHLNETFTDSGIFTTPNSLNDDSLVVSMSTNGNAVYLKKTVKIAGGDGTSANPFVLASDIDSADDGKKIATLTYNNDGTTTTQPIYAGRTNYISQEVADSSFQGWSTTSGGTVSYHLGDTISFTTNTTLYAILRNTLNSKIMRLCNDSSVTYVQKYNTANGAPIDDYQGLGTEDVCYYTSELATQTETDPVRQNGNVIFGDYCWQIVRTTATGGVKLVYNGLKTNDDKCPFAAASRPSSQGFVGNSSQSRTMTSISKPSRVYGTGFTYSGTEFTLTNDFDATWSDSTYQNLIGKYTCDKARTDTNPTKCTTIYYVGHYQSSTNASVVSYTIGTLDHYSQIGRSPFNAYYDSPALVGYMYGDVYNVTSKSMTNNYEILTTTSSMGSKNYYYADTAKWDNVNHVYKLILSSTNDFPTSTTAWSGFYSGAVGWYTCLNGTDTSCATVHYIEGAESTTMYTLPLSNGQTADNNPTTGKKIVVSSTKVDNANDYSLGTTENIYLYNWYTNYNTASYKNKYVCGDLTSTTCETMYYITETSLNNITYNSSALHNFTYANDISYNSATGEYTLVIDANTKTFWDWGAKYNTINNAHYTCFNNYNSTTHSCGTEVYYINYTSSTNAYYVKLKGVANIDAALKKMINYGSGSDVEVNKYNSAIKGLIDNWYKQNIDDNGLTQYLEDAVYCNDRSVRSLGGWVKTGSTTSNYDLRFKNYNNITKTNAGLACTNATDRFSSDSANTKAHLLYPVGLLTESERAIMYSGYVRTEQSWWLSAPCNFYNSNARGRIVGTTGSNNSTSANFSYGARPAISLGPDTEVTGEGTYDSPYIVKVE